MIKHITKFTLDERKVELTPGIYNKAHYKHRVMNPEKYNSLLLLETGTNHVYDMFFEWDYFLGVAEERCYRMDYDWCYTADYIEAFGKKPVPQRPGYGLNKVIYSYDPKGWYLEKHIRNSRIAEHVVDGWGKGTIAYTRRLSREEIFYSTYKRERIYTRIYDWYPGFEEDCAKLGKEICDW